MYRRTPPPHHGGTNPTPPDAKRLQTTLWEAIFASKSFEIDIAWLAFQTQMVMMILLPVCISPSLPPDVKLSQNHPQLTAVNNNGRRYEFAQNC